MKSIKIELKWAIIFSVVMLLWMVLEKTLGWHDKLIAKHAVYTNFFAPIAILVYVFALLDKKKSLGGEMGFKTAFVSGSIISMLVALISPLAQYITHNYITPDFFTNVQTYAVESGNMNIEEAKAYFNFKGYVYQSFIGALLMGIATTAIVAIFVRSKNK
ncbi:Protein of unknown function [Spirosomataceae bacterium TFI 002]|nr:Protein of unknown function [Spirosomataceae bacterium TFI 002]